MMRTSPLVQLTSTEKGLASLVRNRIVVRIDKILLVSTVLLLAFSARIQAQSLSVSMSFPAFRSSFITGTPVNIQATTTTPASTTVTKVEFFLATFTGPGGSKETVKLGEDLTAPFSYTWTIPDGQISYNELSLKVTNSTGATAVQGGTGYNRVDVYAPNTASNKKYYVQAGANPGTAGTLAAPFNTIQKGVDVAAPGDSIFVLAGTYTNTAGSDVVIIRRTGTPSNGIVLTNYQNDKPKLMFNAYQGFNLVPGAAYIKIQGFEIVGNNANVTLPQATTQPGSCDNPTGTVNPAFNGNGISLSGRGGGNVRPHHVVLANNTIHDCGGAGISAIESDYVTVENNTVYNNSWYTIFGTSGISFLNSWNYDANTDTPKMIIRNNCSYGNRLFVKWIAGGVCKGVTDGNGIILDNNNNQFGTTNPIGAYTGKFLIENNVCYQNGGRGINVNYSDNATVRNNTFYQNAASPEITSEFAMRYATSVRIYNNIFYTRSDKATGAPVNSPDLLQGNNLTFGGTDTPFFTGPRSLTGVDPRFVDAASGNFQLQPTSPAINAGSNTPGQYATKDILGIDRPQGAGVDMGAYELQGTPIRITQQPASGSAVCEGSPVSVSVGVNGPVQAYQWYKDGGVLTNVASATTATLSLTGVTAADAGSYYVVVTGFNSLTSTAFSLTVNAKATVMITASPNLTATMGSSVTLTASGASRYQWNNTASTPAITVTTAGTYSVTGITAAGCPTTAQATVVFVAPPTRLTVLSRDPENGNLYSNTLKPYLLLQNDGTDPIPYGELTVRYYLTVENPVPLRFDINYAQMGNDRVHLQYVPLSPARQGASGYIEFSFDGSAGSLAPMSNAVIQDLINKQDYSNFFQGDDYSYVNNPNFAANARITAYRNGTLIYGTEPPVAGPSAALGLTFRANPTTILTSGSSTLTASASGGTPGYSYTFSGPGTITPIGNTAQASNLPAGVQTFTVVVTDATTPVSQTASATVSVTVTNSTPANTRLTVLSRDPENGNLYSNTLKPYLLLQNDGTDPIPYGELTVRYYLTVENPVPLRFDINYAQMGNDRVHLQYVPLSPARQGASGYIEFSFDGSAGSLAPMSNAVIQDLINKQDYSNFFQGDDYSYVNNPNFAANARITAYRNGTLIYGTEPPVAVRMAAEGSESTMSVRVMSNPVVGDAVDVVVSGAEGQSLQIELVDACGKLIAVHRINQATSVEQHRLPIEHQPAGIFLLQVSSNGEKHVVRLLKK